MFISLPTRGNFDHRMYLISITLPMLFLYYLLNIKEESLWAVHEMASSNCTEERTVYVAWLLWAYHYLVLLIVIVTYKMFAVFCSLFFRLPFWYFIHNISYKEGTSW